MIIIAMAGESRRFREAGFEVPKYMLPLAGRSLFAWSVGSFERYAASELFVFVLLKAQNAVDFVRREATALGIKAQRVVELEAPTSGQAVTVEKALRAVATEAASDPITIFNIDTIRENFQHPTKFDHGSVAGYLDVFRGPGDHWSFVQPTGSDYRVARTTEKDRISDLCSTGIYGFQSADLFLETLEAQRRQADGGRMRGEHYIAPMYNRLIEKGRDVRYRLIDRSEVEFSGTPTEYRELQQRWEASGSDG